MGIGIASMTSLRIKLIKMENNISLKKNTRIPIWVNVVQIILVLIMLAQVYMYFFDHQLMAATGITIDGVPMLNLIYEMGARTLVMVIASIYVLITQNPKQFLVVLLMNIVREGQEMIIDPLYPVLNAPASPTVDFWIHVVIVVIEISAFIAVYKIARK